MYSVFEYNGAYRYLQNAVPASIEFKVYWEMKLFTQTQFVVGTMKEVQVAVGKKWEWQRERASTFSRGNERWGGNQ